MLRSSKKPLFFSAILVFSCLNYFTANHKTKENDHLELSSRVEDENGSDRVSDNEQDTIVNPVQDTIVNPVQDTIVNPVQDIIVNPVQITLVNSVQDTIVNPVQDTIVNPVQDTIVNPVQDTIVNPVQDRIVNPVQDTIVNLVQDTIPVLDPTTTCSILNPEVCQDRFELEDKLYSDESVKLRAQSCMDIIPIEVLEDGTNVDDSEGPDTIAFAIQVYSDPRQFELLLSTIYKPYHTYCIHLDPTAEDGVKDIVNLLVNCYNNRFGKNNIFVLKNSIPIYWAHFSVLEADLKCMEELLRRPGWMYFMNLAGSELPRQSIKQFTRLSNPQFPYMSSIKMTDKIYYRKLKHRWELVRPNYNPDKAKDETPISKTKILRKEPPFNLTIFKGLRTVVMARNWTSFFINHPVAKSFIDWSRDSNMPEEYVFQTLGRITRLHFERNKWTVEQNIDIRLNSDVRLTLWNYQKTVKCHGVWRNWICVLTLEDLPFILDTKRYQGMIMNKFKTEVDRYVAPCLAEIIRKENL
ncbi:beta-1,3-galactosyl-O-glycosyl-glycoprotein beta-1,6-N-acetylglucosaminyltransferase 4 isoform X2 [Eurytemora carolleeae]|uniref:beta-1,3-galactosyl-O-glycosyl-glycoprotein beta-1,6-N-acetylglucosaminyltransferase 4 isoform X2 n=1 Tax=Eurytemora carolleeae TaxID=1294199 RepID=UPI000C76BACB|nr:beta-1,3-galactosyl-O-glycosyl-glycoprotein beta-1,6-N-acetylglucosaminyltransferase 4 isoform X2 [Eurytemora carolleeae]|eukprot:XP_023339349.1 beta-1,3-galactosyl-O-glycosyl-glycoprotein beta-1,6-N-acetylglucosaminyltransferase 4-like isoform X2 [Eurytemora affinis]